MMRSIRHPGQPAAERWRGVPAAGSWTTLLLRAGLSVNQAVAQAFAKAGFAGGYARLDRLPLAPLRYVIPAASDGVHAAWYSETFAPEGVGRIEQAGAIVGWRDGAPFLHCHGSWFLPDGKRRMGHLLPHDSVLEQDAEIEVFGVAGATFEAEDDPETAFKLFAPRRLAESIFHAGGRTVLCTVRPNNDICYAIEAICREHGINHAQVHGIGSLVGADFEDGSHFTSYATEVLIREGTVRPHAEGPRCRLDIALVGMDGGTAAGLLVRGQNPVCVTFELLIEEMPEEARNKAVIVTGGASGIGRATVERLLANGWRVVAADRDEAALEALPENSRLMTAPLDVTDEAKVEALVARVEKDFAPVGGLVNSAGIGRDVPFAETTAKLFRDIYEINVIGAFLVSKAVARSMAASGGGAIVNIASVSGIRGNIGRAAYGASKGALIQLTKVMAVELAEAGIRVNAIAPGPIETPMVAAIHTEKIRKQWHKTVPLRRYGAPNEIAGAVLSLLDPVFSSYITGQTIAVDGGFTAAGIMEH